jgi:hypothetical protein
MAKATATNTQTDIGDSSFHFNTASNDKAFHESRQQDYSIPYGDDEIGVRTSSHFGTSPGGDIHYNNVERFDYPDDSNKPLVIHFNHAADDIL